MDVEKMDIDEFCRKSITEEERNLMEKAGKFMSFLDRLVFPNNPIKNIFIFHLFPPQIDTHFIYSSEPKDGLWDGEAYYLITGGMSNYVVRKIKDGRMLFFRGRYFKQPTPEMEAIPPYSEQELITSHICHEIRHRFQHLAKPSIFSFEDKERIKYLNPLFECVKENLKSQKFAEGHYRGEFDSEVIESLARGVVQQLKDCNHNDFVRIIKTEPKDFIDDGVNPIWDRQKTDLGTALISEDLASQPLSGQIKVITSIHHPISLSVYTVS